jgi:glycosyltransferase involved in cell wall biosynthesis
MEIRAEHITIAVTVFNRREYVLEAIQSALDQTIPVKVMVVEDCGPDEGLRDFVMGHFGNRIEYFRNPQNRGLFDNWNACMDYCRTPWFSILHDDDLLLSNFVEDLLALAKAAPGRALYFGRINRLRPDGEVDPPDKIEWTNWRDLGSGEGFNQLLDESTVGFSGNLISTPHARELGGFRKNSWYTGDWDMWFRLALTFGAAQTEKVVAVGRCHDSWDRATTRIVRKGWKWLLDNVQRKRNLARLKSEREEERSFERSRPQMKHPIPLRLIIASGSGFHRRVLIYNWWLFTHSQPPHGRYAALQWLLRLFGPRALMIWPVRKGKPGSNLQSKRADGGQT